jgi:peptidoglycan/xylan/chitin deacetylase (PgdA/CDA1 family)
MFAMRASVATWSGWCQTCAAVIHDPGERLDKKMYALFFIIAGSIVAGLVLVVGLTPLWYFYRHVVRRGPVRAKVALTIDDGPNPASTPKLLETLAEANIRVTFFAPAQQLVRFPALAAALVAGGHEIANHTYGHSPWFAFFSAARAKTELARAAVVLAKLGQTNRWFRPVAGTSSPPLRRAARELGLVTIGWSARARDGGPLSVSTRGALRRLRTGLIPGGILVFHDRPGGLDVRSILELKRLAEERGLTLCRLSDLFDLTST